MMKIVMRVSSLTVALLVCWVVTSQARLGEISINDQNRNLQGEEVHSRRKRVRAPRVSDTALTRQRDRDRDKIIEGFNTKLATPESTDGSTESTPLGIQGRDAPGVETAGDPVPLQIDGPAIPAPEIPSPEVEPLQEDNNDIVDTPTNIDGAPLQSLGKSLPIDGQDDGSTPEMSTPEEEPLVEDNSDESDTPMSTPEEEPLIEDNSDAVDTPTNIDGAPSLGKSAVDAPMSIPEPEPLKEDNSDQVDTPAVEDTPMSTPEEEPLMEDNSDAVDTPTNVDGSDIIGVPAYMAFVCARTISLAQSRCKTLDVCKFKQDSADGTITHELVDGQEDCVRRCDSKFGLSSMNCKHNEQCFGFVPGCKCNSLTSDGGECQPY